MLSMLCLTFVGWYCKDSSPQANAASSLAAAEGKRKILNHLDAQHGDRFCHLPEKSDLECEVRLQAWLCFRVRLAFHTHTQQYFSVFIFTAVTLYIGQSI